MRERTHKRLLDECKALKEQYKNLQWQHESTCSKLAFIEQYLGGRRSMQRILVENGIDVTDDESEVSQDYETSEEASSMNTTSNLDDSSAQINSHINSSLEADAAPPAPQVQSYRQPKQLSQLT